jgi:hypothetical protein
MTDMTRDEALESARKWVEHHGTETRAYGPSERYVETAARIIEALTADIDRLAEENERLRAVASRAKALIERRDFWDESDHSIPGEYDDLVDMTIWLMRLP